MRWMRIVRKAGGGLVSVVVVLGAVLYIVGPTKTVLLMTVTSQPAASLNYAASFVAQEDLALTTTRRSSSSGATAPRRAPSNEEVVYGSVRGTEGALPTKGSVTLSLAGGHHGPIVALIGIGPHGLFRAVLRLPAGTYKVVVSAEFDKKWYSSSRALQIRRGRAYDVSAVLRYEGVFTMFPVTSY